MPPADRGGLLLDACGLLNLAGAGVDTAAVQDALGRALLVVEQVVEEALWVHDVVDGETVRLPVDLGSHAFAALARTSVSEDEVALYVALARDLDDGEAATLAVARTRKWAVMTDDRKARRIAGDLGLEVVGTAEVLRVVSGHLRSSPRDVRKLLLRVERRSRFRPRHDDPAAEWWERARR